MSGKATQPLPAKAYGAMVTPWRRFADSDNLARLSLRVFSSSIVTQNSTPDPPFVLRDVIFRSIP